MSDYSKLWNNSWIWNLLHPAPSHQEFKYFNLLVLLSYLKFPTHFWHFAERSWATDSNKMWNYVTTDKLRLEIHKMINTGHLIKSRPHWVLWKVIQVPNNQISIDLYWKSILFHLLMAIGYHCWNNRSNKTKNRYLIEQKKVV